MTIRLQRAGETRRVGCARGDAEGQGRDSLQSPCTPQRAHCCLAHPSPTPSALLMRRARSARRVRGRLSECENSGGGRAGTGVGDDRLRIALAATRARVGSSLPDARSCFRDTHDGVYRQDAVDNRRAGPRWREAASLRSRCPGPHERRPPSRRKQDSSRAVARSSGSGSTTTGPSWSSQLAGFGRRLLTRSVLTAAETARWGPHCSPHSSRSTVSRRLTARCRVHASQIPPPSTGSSQTET